MKWILQAICTLLIVQGSAALLASETDGGALSCFQCHDDVDDCRLRPALSVPCDSGTRLCHTVRRHDSAGHTVSLVRGCGSGVGGPLNYHLNRCELSEESGVFTCYTYCSLSLCNDGPGGHHNSSRTFKYDSPDYTDYAPDEQLQPLYLPAKQHQIDGFIYEGETKTVYAAACSFRADLLMSLAALALACNTF